MLKTLPFLRSPWSLLCLLLSCWQLGLAQNSAIAINEISSDDQVEITNTGSEAIELADWWLCNFPAYTQISDLTVECGNRLLAPGELLVVSGWSVDPSDGELGLYFNSSFASSTAIIDYVEWGSANHERASVADEAGIWTAGAFVPAFTNSGSISWDGTDDSTAAWSECPPSLCDPNNTDVCEVDGGSLSGGPFSFCVGDGEADMLEPGSITLSGDSGSNSGWIVTDDQGTILGLPPMPSVVDFDDAGPGTCLIWHISYEDGLMGLEMGENAANLEGCFSLSNSIAVERLQPDGGTLLGGPFTFCVGDDEADMIPEGAITLAGANGTNSAWIVTDDQGNILGLPPMPSVVDFDDAGPGTCLIWHISYEGDIVGLEMNQNAADLEGCFSLSNSIAVERLQPEGGMLTGGPFSFTAGDGEPDMIPAGSITLSGNSGTNAAWVVTDDAGNILGLPPMPSVVDFDGAGAGTCLVWHLSYEGDITGLERGRNASDLQGCFEFTNPVTVVRTVEGDCQANGGELFGGPFSFTVGDGIADNIPAGSINVANSQGENFAWIVTDNAGNILGLPPMPSAVDFDGAGPGTCLVWYLRYDGDISGLAPGLNANDLEGCFGLSNPIQVIRTNEGDCQANGGMLFGGPFSFCVGDGEADNIPAGSITVTNTQGTNSGWIVTDDQGMILGLPPMPSVVDFDGAGPGTCLIWYISYEDGLTGLEMGQNAADLEGCFSLSNSITV